MKIAMYIELNVTLLIENKRYANQEPLGECAQKVHFQPNLGIYTLIMQKFILIMLNSASMSSITSPTTETSFKLWMERW